MKIAGRGSIRPFEVMEVFREAEDLQAQGRDVLHLALGQPGAKAPEAVLNKAAELIHASPLGYTDACGLPALRERISQHYAQQYDLAVDPSRIFITVGSSAAYFLSLLAAFEHGDTIGIALPCYPAYPNMMDSLGLKCLPLHPSEASGFQPDPALLSDAPTMDGLVIASPSNPTGSVLTPQELRALGEYSAKHNIQMISDEIYHHVTYDDTPFDSMLRYNAEAIVLNSFSKYYLMPGWRLGWAVMPRRLVRSYESLLQSFFISPSSMAQHMALEAFEHQEELQTIVTGYAANRDILKTTLESLGFTGLNKAQGAFYLYANCSAFSDNSRDFCRRMLHETGICAVPGTDFDAEGGLQYVRFSFCGDAHDIQDACERLKNWLG